VTQPSGAPLLEREDELARLAAAVEALADEGTGGLVVVQGPAGIGKTSLLRAVGDVARERSLRVLSARGSDLERAFAYGMVRQLLEPVWFGAAAEERAAWSSGAAALAVPLLESVGGADDDAVEGGFARLHGLYWLCANLAADRPLVVLVDDLQWSDDASAAFLGFLARRVGDLPVLLVVGSRPADAAGAAEAAALLADATALQVRPRPLSDEAVAAWVARSAGREPDASFVDACREVTAGNPLLLAELLREVAAEGLAPTGEGAERVRRLGPAAVSSAVMLRLARLPPSARELARAVAVLGDGTPLPVAARLAGLEEDEAVAAAASLLWADVLDPNEELAFVHPVVRAAIYDDIPAVERRRRHAAAAALLRESGARPEQVAAQLLEAPPGIDEMALETLVAAGREAAARGVPAAAAGYLRRALDEPAAAQARARLLAELGRVEKLTDGRAAIAALEEALSLSDDPDERTRIALDLGWTLVYTEGDERAVRLLDETERSVTGASRALRDRLRAGLLTIAVLEPPLRQLAEERLAEVRERPLESLDGPGAHELMAILAWHDGRAGGDREEAVRRARAALPGLPPAEESSTGRIFALLTLTFADELDDVFAEWGRALDRARERGSLLGVASACCMRCFAHLCTGDLAAAEADGREAIDAVRSSAIGIGLPWASGFLAMTYLARGQLDAAERTLAEAAPAITLATGSGNRAAYREARAAVLLARGKFDEAARELLDAGAHFEEGGGVNPAFLPWRSGAALALAGSDRERAVELASEEVALARAWGAPRILGRALRAEGLVRGGEEGEALLREAVAVLEATPARLEQTRALLSLGAMLRRTNRRTEAREPLRAAHDLARRCAAGALEEQARVELQASGVRARPVEGGGAATLSASERRVVELAAAGRTNRDIAQALFVTEKTVETHLRNAYLKLGVRSRKELPASLAA
jgi:DNA-binding CsgD family transcriptional regulator